MQLEKLIDQAIIELKTGSRVSVDVSVRVSDINECEPSLMHIMEISLIFCSNVQCFILLKNCLIPRLFIIIIIKKN